MLEGIPFGEGRWLSSAVLVAMLLACAYTDLRWRRLPNHYTLGAAIVGLGLGLTTGGLDGGRESVFGWLLGCALLFVPFALRSMGAGDVKLLAAVGALKGPSFVLSAALYMALIGGLIAVVMLVRRHGALVLIRGLLSGLWLALRSIVIFRSLRPLALLAIGPDTGEATTIARPSGELKPFTLPYGVAIAFGGLLALALGA